VVDAHDPLERLGNPINSAAERIVDGLRQPETEGMSVIRTTIAGILIPDSTLARETTEFVQDVSTELLFDHSRRVFLWGSLQGEKLGLEYDPELLYVGAMFHDVGLLEGHRSEHERFEIDGANAARSFLERHGLPEERVMTVWESIALHTTPEVPRYKQPEVRLVTLGVEYDVLGLHFEELSAEQREAVLAAHPRTGFKTGIVEAFSAGMHDKPETAFGTMNTDILEGTVPGYVRPNFCDYIRDSRFDS
jgi:HD domain-containing protein